MCGVAFYASINFTHSKCVTNFVILVIPFVIVITDKLSLGVGNLLITKHIWGGNRFLLEVALRESLLCCDTLVGVHRKKLLHLRKAEYAML